MTTWEERIAAAAGVWAATCARMAALTPREAAEEAWRPGGPSVDELERRIAARRERAREEHSPTDTSQPPG